MDATRYAWAPPRPNGCESPVTDFESRTPKGRGKRNCRNSVPSNERLPEGRRLRKGRRGTVNSSSSNFTAPPSPAKSDISNSNMKRKTKANDVNSEKPKRSRSCSRDVTGADSPTPDEYIVCPEPNCQKKYKHMNGLRYHRTHAHRKSSLTDDTKDEEDEEEEDDEEKPDKKEKTTVSERAERMKAKERQRIKEQQRISDRDSKDSLDDDIPLKEIANKVSGQVPRVDVVIANKDETGSISNDVVESLAVSAAVNDSEAVLPKTVTSQQQDIDSVCNNPVETSQVRDSNLIEAQSSASSVSPVCSASECSLSVVVNTSSSKMNIPVTTCMKSHAHQVAPAVSIGGIARTSNTTLMAAQAQPVITTPAASQSQTATTVLSVTVPADRQIGSKNSGFLKTVSSVRPIVPAPSPQAAGLNNPLGQSFNSQSSAQHHATTLKPIQPKPTIMGDYSVVSPALSDLNREKPRKPKKKKEKDNPGLTSPAHSKQVSKGQATPKDSIDAVSDIVSHDGVCRTDRSAMIKSSNPSKMFESSSSPNSDIPKSPFRPSLDSPSLQCTVNTETEPHVGGSRLAIPSSSQSISSIPDNQSTINDDVHSPAYSDISDANDSNSPQDSPKKDSSLKKDDHMNASHLGPDSNPLAQHYGNMFYYGGPHNYLPHGINPQLASPPSSKGIMKTDDMEDTRPSSSSDNSLDKKDSSRCLQEMNYYAPAMQFPFNLSSFNTSSMDPSYAMLAHQALAAEQKRLMQQDNSNRLGDSSGKRTPSGLPSTKQAVGRGYELTGKVKLTANPSECQTEQKRANDERDQRDKLSENHQILKENIELKSQMGLHHQIGLQEQQNFQLLRQQNDILRAQMYQHQKQKMLDNQRPDRRKGPPDLTSAGQITANQAMGGASRHSSDNTQLELMPPEIRKEAATAKDFQRLDSKVDSADLKTVHIKEEIQLSKSASTQDLASKSRSTSQSTTPNIPPASSSSVPQPSLPSSLTASLPVPLVTSLPPTGAAFPYTPYYPHFRSVPLDTMYRALNPHLISYTGATPGYIHPAQLGFRMPVETDQKSAEAIETQRGDASAVVGNAAYAHVHKIHELHDKGRPSPGINSPAPAKSAGGDVSSPGSVTPGTVVEKVKDKQREYSSSPPTQRHVHTHHHTHVVGGFPPLYPPDAYSAMFGHPAAAAAATIQTAPHPFPTVNPPPAPKS